MKPAFTLDIAKIVGTPAFGFWSQVHTFFPEEETKKAKRGDMLAVIVVEGVGEGVEAVAAGREVLARLHEEYYGNLEESAFVRLENAVQKIGQENQNLEIIAGVILGPVLYLALWGEGQVLLKRGEKIGFLIKAEKDFSNFQTASGFLQEGDLLVFGSNHFFQVVGQGVLRASLESSSPSEAVETLAPIVLSRKDMAQAAALLALSHKKEELPIRSMEVENSLPKRNVPQKRDLPWEGFFNKLRRRPHQPIFVRDENSGKKKVYFFLCLLLLALLSVSLFFGWQRRIAARKEDKFKALVKSAEEKFNQGKVVASNNPQEGKNLIEESQKIIKEALVLKPKNNEEAVFLKDQTDKFLVSLGEEIILSEPSVFMDLNLLTEGTVGKALGINNGSLIILGSNKKLFFLDVEKKSQTSVDLVLENGSLLTNIGDIVYLLGDKGIYEVDQKKKSVTLRREKEEIWGEIKGLSSFGTNLYLLDPENSAIWRYTSGFGTGKNWFSTTEKLDGASSLAIDSSIWVTKPKEILKFTLGREDSFSLSKMPEEFGELSKIYTSPEANNLYVLDKTKGKIFAIAKNGEFKAAYSWEGFKKAEDLVVSETKKKIFVLVESKIYQVEVK